MKMFVFCPSVINSFINSVNWSFSFLFFFILQQFSDQNPESASGIKLTMAQLYLVQGSDLHSNTHTPLCLTVFFLCGRDSISYF